MRSKRFVTVLKFKQFQYVNLTSCCIQKVHLLSYFLLLNEIRLNGTYADLDGNDGIGRAMMNLTGGEVNRFMLREFRTGLDTLYNLIEQAIQHGQMVGCCTSLDSVRK